MNPPTFSVVTVVYNDRAGLERTRDSVASQHCRDFEWIVVDGGSKDGTVDILRSMPAGSPRWVSERDRGIYDAMNKGTAMAMGRYVVFLNAGDSFFEASTLSSVQSTLAKAEWPELLYGGAHYLFGNGSRRYRAPRRFESSIWHSIPSIHQATFYRRDCLDFPPYDLKYPVSADYYISARCFVKGSKACYLNSPVADFSVGGNSMQKSYKSLMECWRIQRDVLHLNVLTRSISFTRRYLAHRGLQLFHRLNPAT